MKFKDLDTKAKTIAKKYQTCERELLEVIIIVDQKKAYSYLGYNSLFSYVKEALGLSEAVAYCFIRVARKAHEVPELKTEVLQGRLSIHKAKKITAVLTKDNKTTWFQSAATKTHEQLEREVSLANPKTGIPETMTYVSKTEEIKEKVQVLQKIPRVQLQVGVSEKIMIRLRRVQDLESQRQKKNVSLEETLETLLETYLRKNDPVEKAKRQKMKGRLQILETEPKKKSLSTSLKEMKATPENYRTGDTCSNERETNWSQEHNKVSHKRLSRGGAKSLNSDQGASTIQSFKSQGFSKEPISKGKPRRQRVPARVRHQVHLRDEGRCTHKNEKGERCSSRRYLDIHHIHEVAKGGGNDLGNLTTLCRGHHKAHHRQEAEI